MKLLFDLLERKNLVFRSFHSLCSSFLDQIAKGDTSSLEQFQTRRQSLLHVVGQIEQEITTHILDLKSSNIKDEALITDPNKTILNRYMLEKDSLIQSILDLDREILRKIDQIKENTIQKLQSIQVGRKTLGAYKSPMENLENLALKQIDKEA